MLGIGVDIENIARFAKKNLLQNRPLLKKIYTARELKYCFSKKNPAQHLAARYAAKEAIFKACSSASIKIMDYKKIEITKTDRGAPLVQIHGISRYSFIPLVSLSHCSDKAIAFAVILKN